MEIRPIKKLGGPRASRTGRLEWNDFIHLPIAKLDMIECSCFHQYKPFIYIVTKDSQVFVFDILTKFLQCKTTYENLVTSHRPVKIIQTHNFLCLIFENGEIICWNSETMALLHVHEPEKEFTKKPVIICCEGTTDPLIFIANQNEQRVSVFDLETFTLLKGKYGCRKPIVGMCVHPTQSVLATCCTDGEIRLWDYKSETLITSVEGAIPSSNKYFLSFNSTGEYFIVGMPEGNICVWGPKACKYDDGTEAAEVAEEEEDASKMLSFYCSSSLNCLCEGLAFVPQNTGIPLVLTVAQGVVMGWDLKRPSNPKMSALKPSLRFDLFSFKDEYKKYTAACPKYLSIEEQSDSTIKSWNFIVHRHRNAVTCIPYAGFETTSGANICIYETTLCEQTACTQGAPLTSISHESALWGVDGTLNGNAFSFPTNSIFYLNEQNLWAYSLESEKAFRSKQLKVPQKQDNEQSVTIPVGIRTNYNKDVSFILWETRSIKGPAIRRYSTIKKGKQFGVFLPGKDIAFCGEEGESYIALQNDGHSLEVGSTSCDLTGVAHYELDTTLKIGRIFSVYSDSAVIALNYREKDKCELLLLKKDDGFTEVYAKIELGQEETVIQVAWQTGENGPLGALLTSDRRILLIDKNLNILRTFDYSSRAGEITSIFWVGYALLYTTGSHVKALYLDGTDSILLTLNTQNNYICGVLSDRIILGSWSLLSTIVYSRPISLLEPLVSAELAYSIHFRSEPRTKNEIGERLHQLLAHFEWQRISPSLVYRILAAGLNEDAVILASSSAAFSTNATQIDANVVHRPNEPQLLCTTGDQTPFYECLQGETCNAANSSFQDVVEKSYHATKEDLGKSGFSSKILELSENLLTQAPSSLGGLGVNYNLMDTVSLGAFSNYVSSNPTKGQAQKISLGKGARLFTTVADKPIGKLMWVDEVDASFPASTLDNKSGFGGNYFNTTGTSTNPKARSVVNMQTGGTFCMEKSLDELCNESIDNIEFTKKIDLDVDMSFFDGPLISKSRTNVVEFDGYYDDCENIECDIIGEIPPAYKAKYNRKLTMDNELIFSPSAYIKAAKRSVDKEIIFPLQEKKSPSVTRKSVPNTKTLDKSPSPATPKRPPPQVKKDPEDNEKAPSRTPPPPRRPPAPPSPAGPGLQNSPKEPKRQSPIMHRKIPSETGTDERPKRIMGHKKSPSMSQSPSGSTGLSGTPARNFPPVSTPKAQQRPHGSAPTTPKGTFAPRSLTSPEFGPLTDPLSPTSGKRPQPPPPPPMQKKSLATGHRVVPKTQQQARPPPSPSQKPSERQGHPRSPFLDTTEYQESRAAILQAWNKRQYDPCLKLLDPHIKMLATEFAAHMDDRSLDKEMFQLISYKSAIYILKRIIATDKSKIAEIALYTKMLTDLMLHAQHRVDCIRLAITKNMEAENFGTVAKLIQAVLPLNLPDKKEMEEKFEACKAQKFAEKNVIFYSCPGCGKRTPTILPECKCGTPVKFSCKTFELLKGPIIMKCSICDALFNKDDVEDALCTYCGVGTLCEFNVEAAAKRAMASKP